MFFSQKGIVAFLLVANSVLTKNLFASASYYPKPFPKPWEADIPIWYGNWGGWKGMMGSPFGGYFACGAQLKFEGSQGGGDDTAANGLILTFCHLDNWNSQFPSIIYDGNWGQWTHMMMCPYGYFIDGARVRYENPQGGGDDTALNGLQTRCRHSKSNRNHWVTVHPGIWGDWKPVVANANMFVSAADVRFEDPHGGDDTAMNGLRFRFSWPTNGLSNARPEGEWVNVISGDSVAKQVRVLMTWNEGQSVTKEKSKSAEMSVSAGFEYKIFSASVSVTGALSKKVSNTMSSSFSKTVEEILSIDCSSLGPGLQVLWQWRMVQPTDEFGPGFTCMSNQYRCTKAVHIPPRCPLGACIGIECQECVGFDDEF